MHIQHLWAIYDLLAQKNVLNVDSALNLFEDDKVDGLVAYLQPKGVNRLPTSHLEVQEAVLCVLDALVVCTFIIY